MKNALMSYCPKYLLPNKLISDCNPPKQDNKVLKNNSCRLCKSCGSGFNIEGGSFGNDSNWPNFFNEYGD